MTMQVFYPGRFGSSLTKLVLPAYDRNSEDIYTFGSWEESHRDLEYGDVLRATAASPNYFTEVSQTGPEDSLLRKRYLMNSQRQVLFPQ